MSVKTMAYEASLRAVRLGALVGTFLSLSFVAEAATLKDRVVVDDTMVRLGDLFNDAGEHAGAVVMEAPAPGQSGHLTIYELDRIATQYGLDWQRPTFLRRIDIVRDGVPFSIDDLQQMVLDEAVAQGASTDVEIRLYGRKNGLYLPQGFGVADISFERFDLSDRKDRFTAVALIPTGTGQPVRLNLTGALEEMRLVPMFNRVVAPGEVVTKRDISWEKFPVRRINTRTVMDTTSLVGQTVKRAQQPGKPILDSDVAMPVVIAKGSMVTMTARMGPMVLTAAGRALEDGGQGEIIRVMNNKSKQMVDVRVVRAGQAEVVGSSSLTLAAN
ncbi:MAG: flagellar basal body P-ring formation protein FlgA [Alphaproteobacteria bacterium]|nr:MAG: flagellar basal body P-ring formation protein FlgA [Alphaproteobacteria bacterium]